MKLIMSMTFMQLVIFSASLVKNLRANANMCPGCGMCYRT